MLKIATWNVNSLRVRLPQVLQWLQRARPDVLALQETKTADAHFPALELEGLGYQVIFHGQKAYNGVALLSRAPWTGVQRGLPHGPDGQARFLAGTSLGIRFLNVYVPNGEAVGSDKFDYKLAWLEALTVQVAEALAEHPQLVVLGDFNIAPEDRDCYDPALLSGGLFCSAAERAALRRLLDLGLVDCFRAAPVSEGDFSWWDYRGGAFRRNHGLRIDLILASRPLATRLRACRIDREVRAWPRPSDHAPVVAEFDL